MSDKELKKYIINMVNQIDNPVFLKYIFNYAHKFFIKRSGK